MYSFIEITRKQKDKEHVIKFVTNPDLDANKPLDDHDLWYRPM
jgi:hypothetical protein